MKKVYSLFGTMFIVGVCLAQQSATGGETKVDNKNVFKLQVENVTLYNQIKNNKVVVKETSDNSKSTITANEASQKPGLKPKNTQVEGTENQ